MSKRSAVTSKRSLNYTFEYDDADQFDKRIDDIIPIIEALQFLRQEAKARGNSTIDSLIGSCFNMCLIAFDILMEKYDKEPN